MGPPSHMTGVLVKRGNLDTEACTGGEDHASVKMAIDKAKERGLEQSFPSEPSEGANPAHTWISDFWPPESLNKPRLLFQSPSFWYFVMAALGNEHAHDS